MHAKIFSATTIGIDAHLIEVEVDIAFGLVNFYIVGLPDTAVKESSKRILTALKNSGFQLPSKKITVNLAPADLKKEGTLFDLPIAIGHHHCRRISHRSIRHFCKKHYFWASFHLMAAFDLLKERWPLHMMLQS